MDEHLRSVCFASLDVLCAQFGPDIPYRGGLDRGFPFGGRRVPFLSPQKGIFRAAAQTGPAALSINTSAKSPYDDEELPHGFLYAYRAGSPDQPDNRALRAAHIVGDLETRGDAVVANGLSLCSMHRRTFDQNLVGVSPDYRVHVSSQLLDDEDGPMLDLLKTFHTQPIVLPSRIASRPDRERLAVRFERFLTASAYVAPTRYAIKIASTSSPARR